MKVVLLEDVKNLGSKLDIVDVSSGYARNFLLPNKLAKSVNAKEAVHFEEEKEKEEKNRQERLESLKEEVSKLKEQKIILKSKANEKGHLFAQVTLDDVRNAVSDQAKIDISPATLEGSETIKELGEFTYTLKIGEDVSVDVKIEVQGGE